MAALKRINLLWLIFAVPIVLGLGIAAWNSYADPEGAGSVWTDDLGRPFDWIGNPANCPKCPNPAWSLGGYKYECRECGTVFTAKLNMQTREQQIIEILTP